MLFSSQQECDAIVAKADKTWQRRYSALFHRRYRFIKQFSVPQMSLSFRVTS
jgi:hypothetical protein